MRFLVLANLAKGPGAGTVATCNVHDVLPQNSMHRWERRPGRQQTPTTPETESRSQCGTHTRHAWPRRKSSQRHARKVPRLQPEIGAYDGGNCRSAVPPLTRDRGRVMVEKLVHARQEAPVCLRSRESCKPASCLSRKLRKSRAGAGANLTSETFTTKGMSRWRGSCNCGRLSVHGA